MKIKFTINLRYREIRLKLFNWIWVGILKYNKFISFSFLVIAEFLVYFSDIEVKVNNNRVCFELFFNDNTMESIRTNLAYE